ncbi:MAG: hypothetical protein K9L70_04370 [Thiohalocapsa sp.]|nr:hypothetical protein [Thiohalocapsa sp.]MCF7992509.1 hypothetical protein [Thiohalocapsa sp.]
MSDATNGAGNAAAQSGTTSFLLANLPYVLLYAGAIFLVAMTDSDPETADRYWPYFIIVVALVAMVGGWRYAGVTNTDRVKYFLKQVLHWGAVLLVVNLLFLDSMQQFLNAASYGFIVAYILGLGALLSGIYLDWKMGLFGAFLIFSAIGIGILDDNAMLLSVLAVAIIGVGITLLVRRQG